MEEEKIIPAYALDIINENHAEEKKRLWIAVFLLILLLVFSNICWIMYEFRYEDVVVTQSISQNSTDSGSNTVGDFYGGDYDGKSDNNEND